MKTFVEQSQIDKKLCIHCRHCEIQGLFPQKAMCGLYRSAVDDSPLHSAAFTRMNPLTCGGRKWEIDPDIIVCVTKAKADSLQHEDWVQQFMPTARDIVSGKINPSRITCGGLEEAVKLAVEELKTTGRLG